MVEKGDLVYADYRSKLAGGGGIPDESKLRKALFHPKPEQIADPPNFPQTFEN